VVEESAYYPFGMQRYEDSSEPTGFDPYYGFTDRERDEESGLQYFGARYYGSLHGRFSQVDPLLVENPDLTKPQGLNLYAFAYNQPLSYTDPTGMEPVRTMFNPPELNAAQRAAMARDTAYLRDIGYLPPHESAGLKSGPSARASSTGTRSGRGLQVRIDQIYASVRSEPAYVPGVEDVVAKTVEAVAAGSESRTEYGGIRTAAGEYLIWGEGDLIDIQTEIGGVDPAPPEDIFAEIEAAAGFRDVDITVSDLPIFMETSPHQVEHGKFGGMNQRRGTYTRDPTRYYLETGKAPTGYTGEEIRGQIKQRSAAEQEIIGQMYAD
jgi:RHS repeat-associated protein